MTKRTVLKAAMLRAVALAGAFWLLAMSLLTWAVAEDMWIQVEKNVQDFVLNPPGRQDMLESYGAELPGDMEVNAMGMGVSLYPRFSPRLLFPLMSETWMHDAFRWDSGLWGRWSLVYGLDAAIVYKDTSGEVICQSGSFLSFNYSDDPYKGVPDGRGYILLDDSLEALEIYTNQYPSYHFLLNPESLMPVLRLTGRFHGNRFEPVQVDVRYDSDIWKNILILEDAGQEPTVTVYAWNLMGFRYDSGPVRFGGVVYENLTEYLLGLNYDNWSDELAQETSDRSESLFDALITYGSYDSDQYGNYGFRVAVHCRPLQYAVLRLWPAYLVSAAAMSLGLLLYLLWMKKHVSEPLESLLYGLKYGKEIRKTGDLRELCQLEERFEAQRTDAREIKARLDQLQTSLDYAHGAEEKRRRLVSDITHELKTPLAVIHSYAECLAEGIAPEKREQQLSVILEEVRNMDGLVLQMLELSRLEAGKVRLRLEKVDLTELVRGILVKFEPLIKAKGLRVLWDREAPFEIWADKSRMLQVVTNLLGNAVKYTPENGAVTLRAGFDEDSAQFFIENTAEPLSPEALEQVWDSFYRGDASRNEPGTGLGLSLVKNIIKLHGGSCFVRNKSYQKGESLETTVEFGFRVPLGVRAESE